MLATRQLFYLKITGKNTNTVKMHITFTSICNLQTHCHLQGDTLAASVTLHLLFWHPLVMVVWLSYCKGISKWRFLALVPSAFVRGAFFSWLPGFLPEHILPICLYFFWHQCRFMNFALLSKFKFPVIFKTWDSFWWKSPAFFFFWPNNMWGLPCIIPAPDPELPLSPHFKEPTLSNPCVLNRKIVHFSCVTVQFGVMILLLSQDSFFIFSLIP